MSAHRRAGRWAAQRRLRRGAALSDRSVGAPRQLAIALGLVTGLALLASHGRAAPPPMSRDDIICRAASAVGFSYHWGGSCWCGSGCSPNWACSAGSCSGNCPSCTHSGTYGADCSGFVNKTWQVPDPIATTTCGHGPYTAASYTQEHSYWDIISRTNAQRGDAFASSTHIVIFDHGDPWGSLVTYEARGCSYGIVHNWRTCSSAYSAARRINLISSCTCTPGESQSEGCGNCGSHQRTCASDCHWSAWGPCQGQGPCSSGQTQTEGCCDCGERSRSCDGSCQWRPWGDCQGPDPNGGATPCATGGLGPCAEGTVRCVDGCVECVSTYEPTDELCDAFDNDCSGVDDDGFPEQMGESRPALAARMVDVSFPARLAPGARGLAWASFVNEGTSLWRKGEMWLASPTDGALAVSGLYDAESWPAWNVAAVLDRGVAPGERAHLRWIVRAPTERGLVAESFRIVAAEGTAVLCPEPRVAVEVWVAGEQEELADLPPSPTGAQDDCNLTAPGARPARAALALFGGLLATWLWCGRLRRRRRASARTQRCGV